MAIITKIRERAGLAVGIVALSLGLFVVGSDLLTPNSSLFNSDRTVGEIDGEKVSLEEYQNEIAQLEYEYQLQQNKAPGEPEMQGIREQAWSQLIFKKVFIPQATSAGVQVSDEEKIDMILGKNPHQAIKSTFVNQQTKEFDKSMVENYLKNIDKAPPQQKQAWYNFEAKLPDDRIRTKYESLLTKTNYVTTAEAKREYEIQTAKGDFEYLFVPFSSIADSTIKPTEDELKEYLKAHQYKYKSQDTRTLEYVQFMIQPSKDDSAYFAKELADLKQEFEATTDDTVFAKSRTDGKEFYKSMNVSDLPKELSNNPDSLLKGNVYGPYLSGSTYTLFKLVDKLNEGESFAKASHILFKANSPDDTSKAAAKKRAQAVLARIRKGESFEDMARQYGTDGTASQGGDLGWFGENRMVKPFQDAVFNYPSRGLLADVVETDFGYHIIKVTEPKTNLKYKVASISRDISAGDETKKSIHRTADEFKSVVKTAADLDSAVKKNSKLTKMTAKMLPKNATYINEISDGRSMVVWAFGDETKMGDLRLFELNDRNVVAMVTKQSKEGEAQLEDVREQLQQEVIKEKKAKMVIAKLKGKDIKSMAAAYGPGALSNVAAGITLGSGNFGDFGFDPIAVGIAMGLKPNAITKPFVSDNGVGVIKMNAFTPAPETKDYSSYKTQIEQKNQSKGQYYILEALKEILTIKDNRVKFM
jgi:peptidyl-prolyl cis-trans isomerase D